MQSPLLENYGNKWPYVELSKDNRDEGMWLFSIDQCHPIVPTAMLRAAHQDHMAGGFHFCPPSGGRYGAGPDCHADSTACRAPLLICVLLAGPRARALSVRAPHDALGPAVQVYIA